MVEKKSMNDILNKQLLDQKPELVLGIVASHYVHRPVMLLNL